MSRGLDQLSHFLASPGAPAYGVVMGEVVLYFLVGRAVAALVARPARERAGGFYTSAYVAVGALAVNLLVFLLLFARVGSLRFVYVIALIPFLIVLVVRRRDVFAVNWEWALLAFILLNVAFRVPGVSLLEAGPFAWDEFTHWSCRAKQLFVLDHLPMAGEPIAGVAPHYGLFATLLAVGSYVPLGREVVGAGTAWCLVFTILMALHSYEFLRRHGVARLFAAPACTWFLAWLIRGQEVLAATMYADVFIAFGGMLALFHLCDFAAPPQNEKRRAEDGLLAACGLGILVFTKTTGDVIAAGAIGYAAAVALVAAIRARSFWSVARGWLSLFLLTVPALIIRAAWMAYSHLNNPDSGRLLLEQGVAADGLVHAPTVGWIQMIRAVIKGVMHDPPYSVLLAALPGCIVLDLFLRYGGSASTRVGRLSNLALWPPLVIVMFAVVLNYTFGPARAPIDGGRYLAAMLPALLCYVVGVGSRLVDWVVSFDRGSGDLSTGG